MAGSSVLAYNCSGPEWKKLHNNIMLLRFRLRPVETAQFAIPIGLLAVGRGGIAEVPYEGKGFTEPMLVFCNINPAQMTPILEVLRLSKMPTNPLKAMMTGTNMLWNSEKLWTELCRERDAIAAGENAHAEETATPAETATETATATDPSSEG